MKKTIKIISALLLVCAILFTSSCGSSNAQILKNYEKIGDAIKENGFSAVDFDYMQLIKEDWVSIGSVFTFSSTLQDDGSTIIDIMGGFDDVTIAFDIIPATNSAFVQYNPFKADSGEAVINMKEFSYNDKSPADSKGITFYNYDSKQNNEKLATAVMKIMKALMEYITNYVEEDFSYADLGFKSYKSPKGGIK